MDIFYFHYSQSIPSASLFEGKDRITTLADTDRIIIIAAFALHPTTIQEERKQF